MLLHYLFLYFLSFVFQISQGCTIGFFVVQGLHGFKVSASIRSQIGHIPQLACYVFDLNHTERWVQAIFCRHSNIMMPIDPRITKAKTMGSIFMSCSFHVDSGCGSWRGSVLAYSI